MVSYTQGNTYKKYLNEIWIPYFHADLEFYKD